MSDDSKNLQEGRRPRKIVIIGLCKPALAIVTAAYSLLVLSTIVTILFPHSGAGKVVALFAYLMVAGLFINKSHKAIRAPKVDARVSTNNGTSEPHKRRRRKSSGSEAGKNS